MHACINIRYNRLSHCFHGFTRQGKQITTQNNKYYTINNSEKAVRHTHHMSVYRTCCTTIEASQRPATTKAKTVTNCHETNQSKWKPQSEQKYTRCIMQFFSRSTALPPPPRSNPFAWTHHSGFQLIANMYRLNWPGVPPRTSPALNLPRIAPEPKWPSTACRNPAPQDTKTNEKRNGAERSDT